MRLDDGYARYKYARDATGGISGWERHTVFPASATVYGKNENGFKFTVGYPGQAFWPVTDPWQFNSHSLTTATLRDCLVRSTTSGTGTTIISLVNVRKSTPIFREAVVRKFENLVADWKTSRNLINSGTEMFIHPAYQKIIGMGVEVIPLILREMETNLDHWFWALKAITGEDPVPPAHRGRLKLMAKDWLIWASKQGYQW